MSAARRLSLLALLVLGLAGSLAAPGATLAQDRLEQAREESGAMYPPMRRTDTPAGSLRALDAEALAAAGTNLRFELTLDRAVDAATLCLDLPRSWRQRPASGLRPSDPPRVTRGAGRGRARREGRCAELVITEATAGEVLELTIPDRGIPAGTHRLDVTWTEAGRTRSAGHLEVRLYVPPREAEEGAAADWSGVRVQNNLTNDGVTQSETYVTVAPGDPDRIIAGANSGGAYSAWLSTDGGDTWARKFVPAQADTRTGTQTLDLCCDPMSAADSAGNLWYGGLAFDDAATSTVEGGIHVSRIPAGSTDFAGTVLLPVRSASKGTQDKPMMTIDGTPSSPTFGRLWVAWNEPVDGGINIAASFCDTRQGGSLAAERCDRAANWSEVTDLTPGPSGSYIYADVAVGADGRTYATWWDFSAANAIVGTSCPATADCASASNWSAPTAIALLDATGGLPVPFACPILAQPGGRAAPAPQVETAGPGGPHGGAVYVTWSDLEPGSGNTRCADASKPAATHMSWDSFVASASNALPGGAIVSTSAGRKLLEDGGADSDDWFPYLAVDPVTGVASAGLYSTLGDSTRKTTHFQGRALTPSEMGPLTQVSTIVSDYSNFPCCKFGNDYGDYTGFAATNGLSFPVWSQKTVGVDGEIYIDVLPLAGPSPVGALALDGLTVTDLGDGDGVLEPGETATVQAGVVNHGNAAVTGAAATLSSRSADGEILDAAAGYPDVPAGGTGAPTDPTSVALSAGAACTRPLELEYEVAWSGGSTFRTLLVPCSVPAPANRAPTAALTGPDAATTGTGVLFDASGSADPEGAALTYDWDLDGDGVYERTGTTDPTVLTSFATAGDHVVRVRVSDGELASVAQHSIAVVAPTSTGTGGTDTSGTGTGGTGTSDGTSGTNTGDAGGAAAGRLSIRMARTPVTLRVSRGRFVLSLRGCARCGGRLTVTSARRVAGKRVRLGAARFSVRADGRVKVRVRLSRRGRALLRRHPKLGGTVALRVTRSGSAASARGRVILRRR